MIQPIIIRNNLVIDQSFAYTPEDQANKSSSFTVSSTTTYANTKALVDGLATKQNTLSGASLTDVSLATNDKILIQDTSDSNNLKTVDASDIATVPTGGNIGTVLTKNSDTNGDYSWLADRTNETRLIQALGSNIVMQSYGCRHTEALQIFTLINQVAYFGAIWLPEKITITGVRWFQRASGVYTANNFNGVALYSYSAGVITQVAISANDANIWTASANTFGQKAFSSTVSLNPGVYFVGMLYCRSAETTAPSIAQNTALPQANLADNFFSNSAKAYSTITAQTTLSPSYNMSALTTSVNPVYFGLY